VGTRGYVAVGVFLRLAVLVLVGYAIHNSFFNNMQCELRVEIGVYRSNKAG
jgi:hypothetical protein